MKYDSLGKAPMNQRMENYQTNENWKGAGVFILYLIMKTLNWNYSEEIREQLIKKI